MYYNSTMGIDDITSLHNAFFAHDYIDTEIFPPIFHSSKPLKLHFTSMLPDNCDCYFSTFQLSPGGGIYSSMTESESRSVLSRIKLHSHDFFELMFVLDGEIYVNIENIRHLYTKGSCCLLNRNVMHMEEYKPDFRIVFLQISEDFMRSIQQDFLLQFFDVERNAPKSKLLDLMKVNLSDAVISSKDYIDFFPTANEDGLIDVIHDIFDKITWEMLSPNQGSSINIKSRLIELFQLLHNGDNFTAEPIHIGSDNEYILFSHITELMSQAKGRISRKQLAEQLHYSGSYLNEISKTYSGLSLFDYGMTFCMKEACSLLTYTDENITDISAMLGFSNRTHFYRIFKNAYGVTPADYRRRH